MNRKKSIAYIVFVLFVVSGAHRELGILCYTGALPSLINPREPHVGKWDRKC